MLKALYTAATGMNAQELRMSVTANNLANANTTGFKRGRAEFEDLLSERMASADQPRANGGTRPSPIEVGMGVKVGATTRNFSMGELLGTGNPLDVAIEGDGFFQVQRPNGELAYTRAGNFRVDGLGRLVTQNGELLDPNITLPDDASDITIRADGTVAVKVAGREKLLEVGTIELALFTNPGGLHAIGNNLFAATEASGLVRSQPAGEGAAGTLSQGFLEGGNVKPVEEMIALIATQRAYEMNSKVIQTADQMLQRLSNMR